MKSHITRMLSIFLMLGFASSALADRLPHYYPDRFDSVGTVDSMDARGNSLVVGDVLFRISPKIKVHGLRSQNVTMGWVKPGTRIGFSIQGVYLTEVWVLPNNYGTGGEE
ncbi:MAG: hypothetical protein OQL28_15895 [Sedimenticola sp.]|nr:hypothetical protein [Sedimenticola sp.]